MVTMTIPQFMAYERGELSLKDIKRNIDTKYIEKVCAFSIALMNCSSIAFANTTDAIAKVNGLGNTVLNMAHIIGYWLCLFGAIVEILKAAMNGMSKDVWKIFIKYFILFASLYLLPFAFDFVKESFE